MENRAYQLDWDDWNREHIAKHGMSISEVESAMGNDPIANPGYKNRLTVIGPSPLAEDLWYVFSARYRRAKEAMP